MKTGSYSPQVGTIPARVCDYLQAQAKAGRQWIPAVEIEDWLDQTPLSAYIGRAVEAGLIRKRQMDSDRRRAEYSVGDGTPLPGPTDREPDEPLHDKPPPRRVQAAPPWPASVAPVDLVPQTAVLRRRRGPAAGAMTFADVDSMQITNDPIVPRTAGGGDKYGPIFARMIVGQAIKCAPDDAPKVANALRKWRDANHPTALVRAVRHYPVDNMGRVWLLPPAKAGKGGRA